MIVVDSVQSGQETLTLANQTVTITAAVGATDALYRHVQTLEFSGVAPSVTADLTPFLMASSMA